MSDRMIKVCRARGWGPVYIPAIRRVVPEGGEFEMPEDEALARPDWEIVVNPEESLDNDPNGVV